MNFVHYIPSPSSTIKSLLLSKSAYFMSFYCDPLHLIGVSYMHVGEGYLLHQEQRISNPEKHGLRMSQVRHSQNRLLCNSASTAELTESYHRSHHASFELLV